MTDSTLPRIMTVKEVAEYLKVEEDIILQELEAGNLHGFKVGNAWRCSDEAILAYMRGEKGEKEVEHAQPPFPATRTSMPKSTWDIVEIAPFDYTCPKKGGGGKPEHYGKGYEATTKISDQEYTFRIGFGERPVAGLSRVRVTIWLGNRAIVEFASGNDYENDGLLAGIIRLKNGKQLTTQRVPDEYKNFRIERYNSIVRGPRASTGMAVIVHKDDFEKMMEHAIIRARWKEIII